jgi:streptomycin 6-kinase
MLSEIEDDAATEIAAEIMARLFSPSDRDFPADLQPLRERFSSLFNKAGNDRAAGISSLYVEAAETAERLLAAPHDIRPLHGDLHHENILRGERGWLAIDPKGVLGDPAFDAANLFYNPLDRDDLCLEPERIARMAETFSKALGQDVRDILDHAIAYGCLSAAWHAEDGNDKDEKRELAVAEAIRRVRALSL